MSLQQLMGHCHYYRCYCLPNSTVMMTEKRKLRIESGLKVKRIASKVKKIESGLVLVQRITAATEERDYFMISSQAHRQPYRCLHQV